MEDNKYEQALAKYDTSIDDNQVKKAVESILKHRNENKTPDVMKFLLSCVELTSLKSTDSDESIMALAEKINRFDILNCPTWPPSAYIPVLHLLCAIHFKWTVLKSPVSAAVSHHLKL